MSGSVTLIATEDLQSLVAELSAMEAAATEADAAARLTVLEDIKSACAAAQVRETARLDELRRADEELRKIPKSRQGRGLAAEVGLARKASPQKGSQYLGFARALAHEMPNTRQALADGTLTEWRATILVRETCYLTRETREEIDRRMCADPSTLAGVGDRELEAIAKKHAYELHPHAVVARKAKAEKHRRVSVRPAPDLMSQLSALLPMKQGISVYASLKKHADATIGADDRTHAQIMADTLVERVTGQASADAVPVAVNVVMSAETMLGGQKAAEVPGYGPIPAAVARQLIAEGSSPDGDTASTIRRLYARPSDGALVSMDSRSRCFPSALATFVARRDQRCRVAYCNGTVAEIDHVQPHRSGGATSADNGAGLCRLHNRVKEVSGWTYEVQTEFGLAQVIDITAPSGSTHRSASPAAVGSRAAGESDVETALLAMLNAA